MILDSTRLATHFDKRGGALLIALHPCALLFCDRLVWLPKAMLLSNRQDVFDQHKKSEPIPDRD